MRVVDVRVADRVRCNASGVAKRCDVAQFGVAESICADVSWRHLLVQSSELRAFRLCYPGLRNQLLARRTFHLILFRFSPSPLQRLTYALASPARLLSDHPVNAAGHCLR